MVSRYRKRTVFFNNSAQYSKQFKERGVRSIKHFATPVIKYPKGEQVGEIKINFEIYKVGDRYYKYAQKYYGDPTYWWVIAHFNQKPVENMLKLGATIYIPTPLTATLEIYEN